MSVNFLDYYNDHPDYVALRSKESDFYTQYIQEVRYWKNKYLFELVKDFNISSICEVGCATGILLNEFPSKTPNSSRYGVDVSTSNINTAEQNFPDMHFFAGYFQDFLKSPAYPGKFDLIILSDILEHVEDDAGLLSLAGDHARYVVLNLPLEKCGEFAGREYGIQDKHGHLRAYDVDDARALVKQAEMIEEKAIVKQYVLEPVFRQYLANKLFNKKTGADQISGMAKYINEINEIELNPAWYKSNYFGLLKK